MRRYCRARYAGGLVGALRAALATMTDIRLNPRLRIALTALSAVGAMLAALTGALAIYRGAGELRGYAVVAVALVAVTILIAHGNRIAIILALVVCALQPIAVVVTAWELTHHIAQAQADKLNRLGISPRFGVTINLVFSLCASAVAVSACRIRRSAER
jgi:hypothetical protein